MAGPAGDEFGRRCGLPEDCLFAGGAPIGFLEPDLLGLKARGGRPVEGAVHDLPHLVKPPVGALEAAFAPHDAGTAVRSSQAQFHLLCVRHIKPFVSFSGTNLARWVGHGVSTSKIFENS
jgi:hypothetical protein